MSQKLVTDLLSLTKLFVAISFRELIERGTVAEFILMLDLLCFIWERTKWPAANADIKDSSAASTVAQTIDANSEELFPATSTEQPFTPKSCWIQSEISFSVFILELKYQTSRQALCALRTVPPPMVPISIEGIVHETWRSPFPRASIRVIQLELPTVCAGSWTMSNNY